MRDHHSWLGFIYGFGWICSIGSWSWVGYLRRLRSSSTWNAENRKSKTVKAVVHTFCRSLKTIYQSFYFWLIFPLIIKKTKQFLVDLFKKKKNTFSNKDSDYLVIYCKTKQSANLGQLVFEFIVFFHVESLFPGPLIKITQELPVLGVWVYIIL